MSEETKPLEIGLGSHVGLRKGTTLLTGIVDGIKLSEGVLERISIEELDTWLYMDMGWGFIEMEEEDGEV